MTSIGTICTVLSEKGGTPMKWDKEVVLALIGFAGTVVLAGKEIILAAIDKEKAIACSQ